MHIYLDYNASTPVAASAIEAMLPWFLSAYANPSSQHAMGRAASSAIQDARRTLADLVGVGASELFFTSGATEANNLAVSGLDPHVLRDRPRIVSFETEHPSVLAPLRHASDSGAKVDILPVRPDGLIDLEEFEASLGPDVAMVSAMLLNNETGVIQPIKQIADLAHDCGALVHSDATQALGRLPINFAELGVDLATISAHKVSGPKGCGALFVRRGVSLSALSHGGGQERGLRPGTENVPAILGFAAAAQWACSDLAEETARIAGLRSALLDGIRTELHGVDPIGPASDLAASSQSPWTLNVRFQGADAEAVIANLPELAVSAGSACSAGTPEPSHVLTAMLRDAGAASECLRISLGRPTTQTEVQVAIEMLRDAVTYVRSVT